jgi:hypothetical protein
MYSFIDQVMCIFAMLVSLCLGGGLLIFRPLTKYKRSNRKLEIVLAVLLILCGIWFISALV